LRCRSVGGNLPFVATYEAVLDVLGDPTRRAIVVRLRSGPCAVVDLADELPVSRPAVSQHLRVLHDAGLVTYTAAGTRNVYRLRPEGVEPLRRWLEEFWQGPLDSFRDHVLATEAGEPPTRTATATGARTRTRTRTEQEDRT
jgi:DNA-binding transcriptional ArsR family regulator